MEEDKDLKDSTQEDLSPRQISQLRGKIRRKQKLMSKHHKWKQGGRRDSIPIWNNDQQNYVMKY